MFSASQPADLDRQLDEAETVGIALGMLMQRHAVRPHAALAILAKEAASVGLEIIEVASRMASTAGRMRPSNN